MRVSRNAAQESALRGCIRPAHVSLRYELLPTVNLHKNRTIREETRKDGIALRLGGMIRFRRLRAPKILQGILECARSSLLCTGFTGDTTRSTSILSSTIKVSSFHGCDYSVHLVNSIGDIG